MNPECRQGDSQFWTEIKMLTKVRHVHLVSLIGSCNDGQERVLIYQYMTRGTLSDHLYKMSRHGKSNPPLPWELRPAVKTRLGEEQHSLAGWARYCIREAKLDMQ
ncbi:hypothetical protein ACS0TY_029138 [Phlomoides rotata]